MLNMTVLLITSFKNLWDNGWFYRTGFEKNGYKVISFDAASFTDPKYAAYKMTKDIKPNFILHTKDEIPAEVFQDLRRFTKVIQWHPDPIIQNWLKPFVMASDIFFTMSEGLLDEFKKINPNSFWLTQAFEPSFFEVKEITLKDKKAFSADVAFVGNLGSKSQYIPRREYLKKVVDEDFDFKWWGPKIPVKFSTLPLIISKIGRSYGGQFIWGESYAKVAKLSKIFLAFDSMPHIRKSMSARIYTAVGCGAFYMCQHVDGIEEILLPDKEIVSFRSADEMLEKIKYFLEREDKRKQIAEAGRARILKEHTYAIRIKQMIEIIERTIGLG